MARTSPTILKATTPEIVEVSGKYTYGLGEPVEGFKIKTTHYCDLHTDKRWTYESGAFTVLIRNAPRRGR
jgi:hypothetical protein